MIEEAQAVAAEAKEAEESDDIDSAIELYMAAMQEYLKVGRSLSPQRTQAPHATADSRCGECGAGAPRTILCLHCPRRVSRVVCGPAQCIHCGWM